MKTSCCWKSFACGALLTAAVVFSLGAAKLTEPPRGRFQATAARNQLLIVDTATGKAWIEFAPEGGGKTSQGFYESKVTE